MSAEACTVLVADDDKYVCGDLGELLQRAGYSVLHAYTAKETWAAVEAHAPALVLLDLKFPDCRDLSLLQRIREQAPDTEVIMLTGEGSGVPLIVAAIKLGAFDYITKPFANDELLNRVAKALELRGLRRSQANLLAEVRSRRGLNCLAGTSNAIQSVLDTLRRLADTDGCVLIRGESGTGKELAARALHDLSRRRSSPFVAVNCAAIPETLLSSELFGHKRGSFTGANEAARGKFEAAEDGTVFLDEIGDMPLSQQAALLRVLEYRTYTPVGETRERKCAARFVFATNRDLKARVAEGLFREDLFYRINVATVTMQPLRMAPEDIPVLVDLFNQRLSAEMGRKPLAIQSEVVALFKQYDWPGNVRELKHVLEGAMMMLRPDQQQLTLDDLPAEIAALNTSATADSNNTREKEELIRVLRQCNGNQSEAARALRVHRNTIRQRIRYHGIK